MAYHVTDYDIQALIDNELEYEQEQHIRRLLAENRFARERYEELKNQKKLINFWWHQKEQELN